jgi:amino acid permease
MNEQQKTTIDKTGVALVLLAIAITVVLLIFFALVGMQAAFEVLIAILSLGFLIVFGSLIRSKPGKNS